MKLNDRNKRYNITVNFISAKILKKAQIFTRFNTHMTFYVLILPNNFMYLSNVIKYSKIIVNNCNREEHLTYYSPENDI